MTSSPVVSSVTVADNDYSQFSFVNERVSYHTDFKSGLTWLATRNKSERSIAVSSIAVQTNGQIAIGKTVFNCTKWAFEQLCSRLGIPCPFARKIPADLLLSNIERLIKEISVGEATTLTFHFAVFGTDEVIIGCTKDDYQFVTAIDFLTAVAALDGNGYTCTDLLVGDRLIEADMQIDKKQFAVNTISYDVAANLRNSDCGDVNPTARLAIENTTKAFTYVLSTEWGRVDRLRNKKLAIETSFTNFMGKVVEMIVPQSQLQTALATIDTDNVTDVQFKNYYDTFNRAIDNKETIDKLVGMTEDERKSIFKEITIRKKMNALNRLQGLPVTPDPSLNLTKMFLMNIVSEYAKNAVLEEREALRRLAGSYIHLP